MTAAGRLLTISLVVVIAASGILFALYSQGFRVDPKLDGIHKEVCENVRDGSIQWATFKGSNSITIRPWQRCSTKKNYSPYVEFSSVYIEAGVLKSLYSMEPSALVVPCLKPVDVPQLLGEARIIVAASQIDEIHTYASLLEGRIVSEIDTARAQKEKRIVWCNTSDRKSEGN